MGDRAVIDHLDAYTSPRLVEYFDPDPCALRVQEMFERRLRASGMTDAAKSRTREDATGVTIEARYAVGEYDILILSAEQSDGLVRWLVRNGYRLPRGRLSLPWWTVLHRCRALHPPCRGRGSSEPSPRSVEASA